MPRWRARRSPAAPLVGRLSMVTCGASSRSPIHARRFGSSTGRPSPELQMESYPKFHNEVGSRSCASAAASSSASGPNRRKITHTSTSIWAPVTSSAPIALRYSVSIRAWAHTKLIRQIVLTVRQTVLAVHDPSISNLNTAEYGPDLCAAVIVNPPKAASSLSTSACCTGGFLSRRGNRITVAAGPLEAEPFSHIASAIGLWT